MVDSGKSGLEGSGSRPSSVRAAIRGDRVGMATKAALEPSQLESHITSLMRASFGRLKVLCFTTFKCAKHAQKCDTP